MRRGVYLLMTVMLFSGVALAAYAPDQLSMAFLVAMEIIIVLGLAFGILPVTQYARAFQSALDNILQAAENQNGSAWAMLERMDHLFNQRTMDGIFLEYREKVRAQREAGQVLSDINEYINDDILALHSWQSIITQIPGTMTGIGILGTFVGLIIGIRGIEFSSVNMALLSVQTLLSGIQVAFYTSIAGVILSLMFNILYRMAWNLLIRQLGIFSEAFHQNVIPTVEEQTRYRERREIQQIMELLERLPQSAGYSNAAGGNIGGAPAPAGNEQVLMPQILAGLRDEEFVFYLQPRFDLNTKRIIGAEALVRWNHGKLGTVSPAIFIPVLESNGYITKLDQYIWKKVCATIRRWLDEGKRPMPISINVTKTDILAMNVAAFFTKLVEKYNVSPRYLEIEIAENAYLQATGAVLEAESQLRQKGFKVVVDGFNGDYIALSAVEGFAADCLKLDLRRFNGNQNLSALRAAFAQADKLKLTLTVEGIESMEQLGMLRKCGCSEGQGFFLSKPSSLEQFEKMMNGDQAG